MDYIFKDTRTLRQIQAQLHADMEARHDGLVSFAGNDGDYDREFINEMESIGEQLELIEELTSLSSPVFCRCFYSSTN